MPTVKKVTPDVFGSIHCFPKLECLVFEDTKEREAWVPHFGAIEMMMVVVFKKKGSSPSRLRIFEVSNCPKVRSLPPIFDGSLQEVTIGKFVDLSNWEWCFSINVEDLSCCSADWLD